MPASAEITAIANYAGQYQQGIIRKIYNEVSMQNDATVIRNLTAPRNMWNYEAEKGWRPLDISIKNAPERLQGRFKARTIEPKIGMKMLNIIPEELRDTFFSEQLSENAKEYPGGFAQYFWEEQSMKTADEIDTYSYMGVNPEDVSDYAGGTAYTVGTLMKYNKNFYKCIGATTAGQTPDSHPAKWEDVNARCVVKGWGTILAEEITAGRVVPVNLGAITDTDGFDQIDEQLYFSIPEKVRMAKGISIEILCSDNTLQKRNTALLAKYPYAKDVTQNEGNTSGYIWKSNGKARIKAVTWLSGSERIIVNISQNGRKNLVMGTNVLSNFNSIGTIIEGHHGYEASMKSILAFQIADPQYMFCNERA
ncbi:carbohydrate-binding protein [Runella limosa]|uniref:carbohydrate-binding protein n=1 Tax=Runella limosa TaxID=370978 RepID=UPI0003FEBE75|nr:carbohydrate-binding protein [Runella limosa]